jgi:Ulp1 family protease
VNHTIQKDVFNCGVFVCSFIEKFINFDFNYELDDSAFNLLKLRKAMHQKLLDNAVKTATNK